MKKHTSERYARKVDSIVFNFASTNTTDILTVSGKVLLSYTGTLPKAQICVVDRFLLWQQLIPDLFVGQASQPYASL